MLNTGTYIFDNGVFTFTVVIGAGGTLVSLDAPKAMTLKDFFTEANWTEQT